MGLGVVVVVVVVVSLSRKVNKLSFLAVVFSTLTGAGVVVVVSSCKQNVNVFQTTLQVVMKQLAITCADAEQFMHNSSLNVDPGAKQDSSIKSSTH